MDSVEAMMWGRYGAYLNEMRGEEYRNAVFADIDKEDVTVTGDVST